MRRVSCRNFTSGRYSLPTSTVPQTADENEESDNKRKDDDDDNDDDNEDDTNEDDTTEDDTNEDDNGVVGYFSSDFDTAVVTIAFIEHIQTNPLTHASRLPLCNRMRNNNDVYGR